MIPRFVVHLPWRTMLIVLLFQFERDLAGFSVRRQKPLRLVKKEAGLSHTKKVDISDRPLSKDGKLLLSKITEAGSRGDWWQVQKLFAGYAGTELPIFHAVMQHAFNLEQIRAGAEVYRKLCAMKIPQNAPTFSIGLKIFARLGLRDDVEDIWKKARATCELDEYLAGARIFAAAAHGDVPTAASILDEMNKTGVQTSVWHINSAIRACWEAEGKNDNAADFLFQYLRSLGLEPDDITYTCLIGAYSDASLQKIQAAYQEMKIRGIMPTTAFIETYLVTVLRKPNDEPWTLTDLVASKLHQRSPARLSAARASLKQFRSAGIGMTHLCERIDLALRNMAMEETGE